MANKGRIQIMTSTSFSAQSRWLPLARVGWIVLTLTLLAIFIAGLAPRYQELITVCHAENCIPLTLAPLDVAALLDFGISLQTYAGWHIGIEIFAVSVIALLALLIFWRQSGEWMALLVAYALSLFGLNFMIEADSAFIHQFPALLGAFDFVTSMAGVTFALIFFLFPDGRFVPRWTRWAAAALVAVGLTDPLWRALGFTIPSGQSSFVYLIALLGALLSGVVAQVHRYRKVSNATQRQQSKWAMLGLAAMIVPIMIWSYFVEISPLAPGIDRIRFNVFVIGAMLFFFLFLPITFVFSIMRYRLWDIDLLIRRTLVYALLTGLLAVMYFGSVLALQSVITAVGGQQSAIVTVVSTLAIAALFTPLRRRVQDFIDRRFFRAKYNAEQTLAAFANTARDEVDMERLAGALLGVVEETMQPESVSLWLRKTDDSKRGAE